jgi:hypothetical protein
VTGLDADNPDLVRSSMALGIPYDCQSMAKSHRSPEPVDLRLHT